MTKRVSIIGSNSSATTMPGWNDYEYQRFEREFLLKGVIQDATSQFAVTQKGAGANMSVDVSAGQALIEITNTNLAHGKTYKVYASDDEVTNVLIATADATNPRKDRIIARISVAANPNVASSDIFTIEALTGTPAGSPSAPSEPANAITLAIVDVLAGATSITNARITDSRTYAKMSTSVLRDLARATDIATLRQDSDFYAVATGSSNAYAASYPNIAAPLAAGQRFSFKANFTNTASATLTLTLGGSAQSALTLKKKTVSGLANLGSGDITDGDIVDVKYDGTNAQVLSHVPQSTTDVDNKGIISADSSAGTSSTSESTVVSYTVPANDLAAGVQYVIDQHVKARNASTTMTIRLVLGSTTLASWSIASAINFVGRLNAKMTCRTAGASGKCVSDMLIQLVDNLGAGTFYSYYSSSTNSLPATETTIDTTVNNDLKITVQFGSSSSLSEWRAYQSRITRHAV